MALVHEHFDTPSYCGSLCHVLVSAVAQQSPFMHVTYPFDRLRSLNTRITIRGVHLRNNALSTLIIFKINEVQKVLNLSKIIQVQH